MRKEDKLIFENYIQSLKTNSPTRSFRPGAPESAIKDWDFRYPETLRINFNIPVGLGSHGDIGDEFPKETGFTGDPEDDEDYNIGLPSGTQYIRATEFINDLIHSVFSKYNPEIDWRDEQEVEIHFNQQGNVPGDSEINTVLHKIDFYAYENINTEDLL